jgi:hypothetical protein
VAAFAFSDESRASWIRTALIQRGRSFAAFALEMLLLHTL